MSDLDSLQKTLGVSFNDQSRLVQALVHSSYVNENPGSAADSNERLEFLGDAVLGLAVAEKLYQDCPDLDEGEMTKLRSALVRRDALARVARGIGLGDYLYMGKGEEMNGGRHKPANLASALEAVIGAVFIDRGPAAAVDFIMGLFGDELREVMSEGAAIDYKSQLQEVIQSRQQATPAYRLVEATGPDHDRMFTVEVITGDNVLGRGSGRSKKLAEAEAARRALERLSEGFTP